MSIYHVTLFFFSSRRRHTRYWRDWSSDVCSSDLQAHFAKTIGVFLNGDALHWLDPRGHPVRSDSFLMLFNAHHEAVDFVIPARSEERRVGKESRSRWSPYH